MPVLFAHLNLPILWRALAPGPAACGIGGGRAGAGGPLACGGRSTQAGKGTDGRLDEKSCV